VAYKWQEQVLFTPEVRKWLSSLNCKFLDWNLRPGAATGAAIAKLLRITTAATIVNFIVLKISLDEKCRIFDERLGELSALASCVL
jgi:hypothetical protein